MDWIKMRGDLVDSPKLRKIAMELDPQVHLAVAASDNGIPALYLRYMVAGALARLWTRASQVGTFEGADLVLAGYTPADVDEQVGIEGFARWMQAVNWLKVDDKGARLPKFREYSAEPPIPPKGRGKQGEAKPKVERPRDLLFDAIAEITASDAELCGGQIAKVAQALKKQTPPVTPEEVRQFAERLGEFCPWAKDDGRTIPTVGEVGKYVLRVRVQKRGGKQAKLWKPPTKPAAAKGGGASERILPPEEMQRLMDDRPF